MVVVGQAVAALEMTVALGLLCGSEVMVVVGQAVAALEMTVARGLLCGSEVLVVAGQTVATLEMDLVGVLGIVRWAVAVGDMSYIG